MDEEFNGGDMLWISTGMVLFMKNRGHSTVRHESTQLGPESLHISLAQIHDLACQNRHGMITQTQ